MKGILFCLLFFSAFILNAQHITFKVEDAKTHKSIAAVKVSSLHEHTFLKFSTDSGFVNLDIDHDDTLKFEKKDYHPIYLTISHKNFDTTHIIVVNLVKIEKDTASSKNVSQVKNAEYHFLHDNVDNSNLKVHVFDGYQKPNTTQNQNTSFKIASVPLGHVHVEHKTDKAENNKYNAVKK